MRSENSIKRARGGQPGNRNAKGNRGNPSPRRNFGNRGGGAAIGNQNARRRLNNPMEFLLREYSHSVEAIAWLREHAAELSQADFTDDDMRDAALYAAFRGQTPEILAAQGREYELGLYTQMKDELTDP